MKTNDALKIMIITTIFLISISIVYYFVIFLPNSNQSTDAISNTLKCNELYELKKSKYWGNEIGQSKYIFNNNLNTCLAYNIYNDFDKNEYFAMIMDMTNDKTLLYYNETDEGEYFEDDKKVKCEITYNYLEYDDNSKKVTKYGCEKYSLMDEMFEKIRSYGFVVFDGFESK